MADKPFIQPGSLKTVFVLATLLILTSAKAQQWHFGPKLDLHYSGINGNGMKGSLSGGWQIGVFAERQLSTRWSIQPELLYTWSHYKKADNFMTYYNNYGRSTAATDIRLAYISVPVLVRYNLNQTISILAGPQYSLRVFEDENLLKSDDDAFKNHDVSAIAGVQVNLSKVGFYARYNIGLSNINNIDERYHWKSRHLDIGIAVKIK